MSTCSRSRKEKTCEEKEERMRVGKRMTKSEVEIWKERDHCSCEMSTYSAQPHSHKER